MTQLWIVEGTTGEYSDRSNWVVAAYTDYEMAREHAEAANRWYLEHDCLGKRWRNTLKNPFDPSMRVDYTGTDWTVYPVPLLDDLPTETNPMVQ